MIVSQDYLHDYIANFCTTVTYIFFSKKIFLAKSNVDNNCLTSKETFESTGKTDDEVSAVFAQFL